MYFIRKVVLMHFLDDLMIKMINVLFLYRTNTDRLQAGFKNYVHEYK